jgi:hypothetical protein
MIPSTPVSTLRCGNRSSRGRAISFGRGLNPISNNAKTETMTILRPAQFQRVKRRVAPTAANMKRKFGGERRNQRILET